MSNLNVIITGQEDYINLLLAERDSLLEQIDELLPWANAAAWQLCTKHGQLQFGAGLTAEAAGRLAARIEGNKFGRKAQ